MTWIVLWLAPALVFASAMMLIALADRAPAAENPWAPVIALAVGLAWPVLAVVAYFDPFDLGPDA